MIFRKSTRQLTRALHALRIRTRRCKLVQLCPVWTLRPKAVTNSQPFSSGLIFCTLNVKCTYHWPSATICTLFQLCAQWWMIHYDMYVINSYVKRSTKPTQLLQLGTVIMRSRYPYHTLVGTNTLCTKFSHLFGKRGMSSLVYVQVDLHRVPMPKHALMQPIRLWRRTTREKHDINIIEFNTWIFN